MVLAWRGRGGGDLSALMGSSDRQISTHTLSSFTHSSPQKQSTETISLLKGTRPERGGACQKREETEALLFPSVPHGRIMHQGPGLLGYHGDRQNYPTLSAS